jgi:hypothetical protein
VLNIVVKPHIEGALATLRAAASDQVPYATMLALNNTAKIAKEAVVAEMRRAFRSPVPFTLGAIYVSRATKQKLMAQVSVKNQSGGRLSPVHWLYPEVEGGARSTKAFEKALQDLGALPSGWAAVPANDAPRDSFGNVSGAYIRRMLSVLQSTGMVGPKMPSAPTNKVKRAQAKAKFFAIPGGAAKGSGLTPGIYQREGTRLWAIFAFIPRVPSYRKRYNFYEIGTAAADKAWPAEFEKAMAQAMATRR